jgi:hypothetical protein
MKFPKPKKTNLSLPNLARTNLHKHLQDPINFNLQVGFEQLKFEQPVTYTRILNCIRTHFRSSRSIVRMPFDESDFAFTSHRLPRRLRRWSSSNVSAGGLRERRAEDESQQRKTQLRNRSRALRFISLNKLFQNQTDTKINKH